MPISFWPCFAVTAAATSLASVRARSLTEPRALHFGHSHQPPPSEGSTETESRPGVRANWSRASLTTSLRRAGVPMQGVLEGQLGRADGEEAARVGAEEVVLAGGELALLPGGGELQGGEVLTPADSDPGGAVAGDDVELRAGDARQVVGEGGGGLLDAL